MSYLKSISLMLALCFFTSAIVPAGAQASVKEASNIDAQTRIADAFDRFKFAMNVEWDQQDIAFKNQSEMELAKSLATINPEELQAYTANSITDVKTRTDFNRLVAAMDAQNLSQAQAALIAQTWAEKNNNAGVNFMNGSRMQCGWMCKIVTVVVIVVVIKLIWKHREEYNTWINTPIGESPESEEEVVVE